MKRVIALLLAAVLLLSLGACGKDKEMTPEQVLAACTQKMTTVKSAVYEMEMKIGVKAGGMEIPVSMTMKGECIMKPMAMHMGVNMDLGFIKMDIESYVKQEDGAFRVYTGMDQGKGFQWFQATQDQPVNIPASNAADILKVVGELTQKETDGSLARYEAVITGRSFKEYGNLDQQMGMMGDMMEGFDLSSIPDDVKIPVSFLIDRQTMYLLEETMDLSQLMSTAASADGSQISEAKITVRMDKFDSVKEIVIPPEALSAPKM